MRAVVAIRSLLFLALSMGLSSASFGQIRIGISVGFAPPAIPVYEQPICPADGWIWTPGYWAYEDDDGYYWVPGTWVEPPEIGFLWTPGYWAWGGSAFFFHEGYWGPRIGFYGGVNYGFGYFGHGYEGGRWEGGRFSYNTYVNHVNTTIIHNTYNTRIENVTENRISYNGGHGGIEARPTSQEESYGREHHVGPVSTQNQHFQQARTNPQLRASVNQGRPPIAATSRPGEFHNGAVASREAGAPYRAPERNGNNMRTESNMAGGRPNPGHANELQSHTFTPPSTGNPATDRKYQQQQEKLAAKQNQEHLQLQQQQEKEHQKAIQKNYDDARKQQMEQRHTQQTQHMEQQHATQQQQHMREGQAPQPQSHAPEPRH